MKRFIGAVKRLGEDFKSHFNTSSISWNFFSKTIKAILLIFVIVVLFFAGLILTVSKDFLKEKLRQSTGLIVSEEGFRKLFPLGVELRQVSIMREEFKRPVLTLDKLRARLDILYLLKGEARVVVNGYKGAGSVQGDILVKGKSNTVNLWIDAMELNAVPYLDSFDLGRNVGLSGRIKMTFQKEKCPSGSVDVEGRNGNCAGFKISGFPVPLGDGLKTTLSAELKDDCNIHLKGLWLDSKNFSANVNGYVLLASQYTKSPIDLSLEIMPRASFVTENDFLLSILTKYRKSSSYYFVKIKGSIERPILSN